MEVTEQQEKWFNLYHDAKEKSTRLSLIREKQKKYLEKSFVGLVKRLDEPPRLFEGL